MSEAAWSALADRLAALAAEQEFRFTTHPFAAAFQDEVARFRFAYPFGGTTSAPAEYAVVIGTGPVRLGEFARINRFRWLSWAAGLLHGSDCLSPAELHWWKHVRASQSGQDQKNLPDLVRSCAEAARQLAARGDPVAVPAARGKVNNWPTIQAGFRVLRERFNSPRWHTARPDAALAAFPDYHAADAWHRQVIDRSMPHPTEPRPWSCRGSVWGEPEEVDGFADLATDAGTALPLELTFTPPLFPMFNCVANTHPARGTTPWLEFLFLACPAAFTLREDTPAPGCRVARLDNSPFAVSVMAIDKLLRLMFPGRCCQRRGVRGGTRPSRP